MQPSVMWLNSEPFSPNPLDCLLLSLSLSLLVISQSFSTFLWGPDFSHFYFLPPQPFPSFPGKIYISLYLIPNPIMSESNLLRRISPRINLKVIRPDPASQTRVPFATQTWFCRKGEKSAFNFLGFCSSLIFVGI